MIKSLIISILTIFGLSTALPVVYTSHVSAQAPNVCSSESNGFLGFPTWYKYLDPVQSPDGSCEIALDPGTVANPDAKQNPEVVASSIGKVLLAVFEILLRIAGLAAVGFVMFGGFQYLISQGEPDRTKGAKTTILNAMIGLAIAISATAIVNIIGRNIS